MRRLVPVLALLAACARAEPAGGRATVTLLGAEGRLEEWRALAIEGRHLHALAGGACDAEDLLRRSADLFPERPPDVGASFAAMVEATFAGVRGPAYGGPGRLALALRRHPADAEAAAEAVVLELPAPGPGEVEREFTVRECRGEYLGPSPPVRARLEGGRVRVRRLEGGGYDFELFLILRPDGPGAGFERLQVVARLETAAPR